MRRGHANILCVGLSLTDDTRRESAHLAGGQSNEGRASPEGSGGSGGNDNNHNHTNGNTIGDFNKDGNHDEHITINHDHDNDNAIMIMRMMMMMMMMMLMIVTIYRLLATGAWRSP